MMRRTALTASAAVLAAPMTRIGDLYRVLVEPPDTRTAASLLDDFIDELEQEADELDDILDTIESADQALADDMRSWQSDTRILIGRLQLIASGRTR